MYIIGQGKIRTLNIYFPQIKLLKCRNIDSKCWSNLFNTIFSTSFDKTISNDTGL